MVVTALHFWIFATLEGCECILGTRMRARPQFLVYESDGLHHWRFIANNGETVAISPEGYESEIECLDAIDALQDQAKSAPVVDHLFDPTPLAIVR